eukprot:6158179-Pyramimonas_sp.AAC.1
MARSAPRRRQASARGPRAPGARGRKKNTEVLLACRRKVAPASEQASTSRWLRRSGGSGSGQAESAPWAAVAAIVVVAAAL